MTRILVAESQNIVRYGIRMLLNERLSIPGISEAEDTPSLIEQVTQQSFDIVILDIELPGMQLTRMLPWLMQQSPDLRILIFSAFGEDVYGFSCMRLGASGFLHKSASEQEIIKAVSCLSHGKTYFSRELAELKDAAILPENISDAENCSIR